MLVRVVTGLEVEVRKVRVVVSLRVLVEDTERLLEDRVLLLFSLVEDGTDDENELVITVPLLGVEIGVDNAVVEFK